MEQFEVIFLDEDKKTVLDKQTVTENEKVKYNGKTPEKDAENGVRYVFDGWDGEEKLECIKENLTVIAKYKEEVSAVSFEDVLYDATLDVAKEATMNSTMAAGEKISGQIQMLEKDSRSPEEIVNDILKNGKTEIAPEKNEEIR